MLKKMKKPQVLTAVLLSVWCLLFLRGESTEKSMIRAILLERGGQGWTVGFLYQSPEATADSSDAENRVQFSAAEGESLSLSLSAAEKLLPQRADYRLCDYILLAQDSSFAMLEDYAQLLLERKCGRLASQVFGCDFNAQELAEASKTSEQLPEMLLQCVKQNAAAADRLYARREGLLVPQLHLLESGVAAQGGGLLCENRVLPLKEDVFQAALLLRGKIGTHTFDLEGQERTVRRCLVSVSRKGERARFRLDCQWKAGTPPLTRQQAQVLEQLCCKTVQLFWENGVDLLCLKAHEALRTGRVDAKNACPQLQADVRSMQWF